MNSDPSTVLSTDRLTKRYGRIPVLDGCSLEFRRGQIHALLGANGAGKSTFVKSVAGLIKPSDGQMWLAGQRYAPRGKRDAESAGVQIVQQELNLIATLSVAENLMLSRLPSFAGVIHRASLRAQARTALDRLGLKHIKTDRLVSTLGVGNRQMVEIASALDRDCKLLILDEPTAALSAGETRKLFDWLQKLKGQGTSIIYISHRLEEVHGLADPISILRDGRLVGTYAAQDLTTEKMIDLMSGTSNEFGSDPNPGLRHRLKTPALRVKDLSRGFVKDVTLQVAQGERLGIAGLVGSGRTELMRMIFGADLATSGFVFVKEDPAPRRFESPQQAMKAGIAMVTEDRKEDGLLLSQSIRVNTSLCSMWKRFSQAGLIRIANEADVAREMCRKLETRCTTIEQVAGTLSGGNQQKVAVAKWLVRDADIFLFDEPTRGIDVAARKRIHLLIDSLADQGKAIVMVSSDLTELLETCDRIAVMSNGRLVETFDRPTWSQDRIMQAAFSGYLREEPPSTH
jgi:ribose transport system ATP-binding protein